MPGGVADAAADTANAETFEEIRPETTNRAPRLPVARVGGGPSVLHVQILLSRAGFSPGVLDGRWGKNTEKAVYWFQHRHRMAPTGRVDGATYAALVRVAGGAPPLQQHRLAAHDVEGPFVTLPEDVYDRAELSCLCYESLGEKLAERFHTTEEVLRQLNPGVDLDSLAEGATLWAPAVPDARAMRDAPKTVARIVISKNGFYTQALDAAGNIVLHFPSTLGSGYDPTPDGDARVAAIAYDPHFHYQPTLFHEVPDEEPEALLNPGPNSPVGVVWIALNLRHYGIHGTSEPETIGYTTSHGCVRLTNWDALRLAAHTAPGTPVEFR